jgi:spore germination cell wall hydrolase CwlJ-like protein
MKILKIFEFVVLFGCIFTPTVCHTYGMPEVRMESNNQISDPQTHKKNKILNELKKQDLLIEELKNIDEDKQNDILCVALNIYHESRGSSLEDQIATSYVVFNRYNDNSYPLKNKRANKSICDIIFDKYQFCWTNNEIIPLPKEAKSWNNAQQVAFKLLNDSFYMKKAQEFELKHYVVSEMLASNNKPKWINKRKLTIQIGKHAYMAINEDLKDNNENKFRIRKIFGETLARISNK